MKEDKFLMNLVANEVVESRKKLGVQGVLCKLDREKAYDHVNWKFLDFIFSRMGFGKKWRTWVSFLHLFVRYAVLVNGNPWGFFGSSRGLRQGNHLSPMFFYLGDGSIKQDDGQNGFRWTYHGLQGCG